MTEQDDAADETMVVDAMGAAPVEEMVKGTVDDIAEKLAYLDDDQLPVLRALEEEGENRVTLIAAIDREIERRPNAQADSAAARIADLEAKLAETENSLKMALEQNVDLQLKLRKAGAPARQKAARTGKPIAIDAKAEAPGLVALTGDSHVVLVDGDDVPLAGLPPLAFGPSAYRPDGEAVVLRERIAIPVETPGGDMAAAFLLSDGKAVGVARLVAPFAVGGGRSAELPAGTLKFAKA